MSIKIGGNIIIDDEGNITSPTITDLKMADSFEATARYIADQSLLTSLIPYVLIGEQKWMAENLNVSHYRDGAPIPTEYNDPEWAALSTPAYSGGVGGIYGKLYNWWVIEDGENNHRGICPEGFHVPSDAEWTILSDYLDGTSVAGGKMKILNYYNEHQNHWNSPNEGADNLSGFSAFPAGYRSFSNGTYTSMGYYGYFWSSSEVSSSNAWDRVLSYDGSDVNRSSNPKRCGFSIRCLGDGQAGIQGILSNETHAMPVDEYSGDINYSGSGTEINAYIGTTQLDFENTIGTVANSYKVTGFGTNITPGYLNVSGNGQTVVAHECSDMLNTTAFIMYGVEGEAKVVRVRCWGYYLFISTIMMMLCLSKL